MGQIGDVGVGRHEAGGGGVGLAGVVGEQVVIPQPEQGGVPPEAGVELLAVHEQEPRAGNGIGRGAERVDVGDALLLVDDQVLDQVEALPPGPGRRGERACCGSARRSSCGRGGRRPTSPGPAGRPVGAARDGRPCVSSAARVSSWRRVAYSGPRQASTTTTPAGTVSAARPSRVEVAVLEGLLAAHEGFVGVTPGVVRARSCGHRQR